MLSLLLDTNVVLDWLVFSDPLLAWLDEQPGIHVVAHAAALTELERVLCYPQLHLSPERQEEVLQRYRQQVQLQAAPAVPLPRGFPQCRDIDDQHFIAAAYTLRVSALVSRDRQVLKLRRRALQFGLRIVAVTELDMLCSARC